MGGPLRAVPRDPRVTRQAYYAMTLKFNPQQAGDAFKDDYIKVLAAEGCGVGNTYSAVYANPLLNLYAATSPVPYRDPKITQNYREKLKTPGVERAVHATGLVLMHRHLLGDQSYLDNLLLAVRKVNDRLPQARKIIAK